MSRDFKLGTLIVRCVRQSLRDVTQRLGAVAVEARFSLEAAATLRTDVTSTEEIEAGGGRFYFFR